MLEKNNISRFQYLALKHVFKDLFDKGHDLPVCFGSLVFCCKPSRECVLRDRALQDVGLSKKEYLALKKKLGLEFQQLASR